MSLRITATLLKYGEDTYPDGWGDVVRFSEGSLYLGAERVALLFEHQGQQLAVGYSDRIWTEKADDGATVVRGDFTLLDTPLAQAVEAELLAGIRQDVSVGVVMDEYTAELIDPEDESWFAPQRLNVAQADLVETSLTLRGRMPSAQVDGIESPANEGIPA